MFHSDLMDNRLESPQSLCTFYSLTVTPKIQSEKMSQMKNVNIFEFTFKLPLQHIYYMYSTCANELWQVLPQYMKMYSTLLLVLQT